MLPITIHDATTNRYYRATLSLRQARRHDNGALISCGLSVPDDLRPSTLASWLKKGIAREISHDEWNHSGCQSYCKRRGDTECRW